MNDVPSSMVYRAFKSETDKWPYDEHFSPSYFVICGQMDYMTRA